MDSTVEKIYAKLVFDSFDTPFISLDIACCDGSFALIEFQMLCFGTYTLERSQFYFYQQGDEWTRLQEVPVLEREVARSVAIYIAGLAKHANNS